jgi:hypothetical protein
MYVFSFALYGAPCYKYYTGLLENLIIIAKHYPDWKVYVYTGADVPETFINTIRSKSAEVVKVPHVGHIVAMYRFLPIDNPDIECMIVRDADSRIHSRDRWAINEFVRSNLTFHSIRDHSYHTIPILAGLWGVKKGVFQNGIRSILEPYLVPSKFGTDQEFLSKEVFPIVKNSILVHTSQSYRFDDSETIVNFPFQWTEVMYCGKAEGNNQLLRIFRR